MKLQLLLLCLVLCIMVPAVVFAQLDTMESPVVKDAKAALEKGDVLGVLKWVKPEGEVEVCEVFNKVLAVRTKDAEVKALADKYFCETVVKLNRVGAGESYTGLKAASKNPAVLAAYKAMDSGATEEISKALNDEAVKGLVARLPGLVEKKKKSEDSMDAGKEYANAYMEFMRYVTKIYEDATVKAPVAEPAKK